MKQSDSNKRLEAADELVRRGYSKAADLVRPLLSDQDSSRKMITIRLFGRLHDIQSMDRLISCLKAGMVACGGPKCDSTFTCGITEHKQ